MTLRRGFGNFGHRAIALPHAMVCALLVIAAASSLSASHYRGGSVNNVVSDAGVVTVDCFSVWRSALIGTPAFTIRTGPGGTGTSLGAMTLSTTTNPHSTGIEFGGAAFTVRRDVFTFNIAAQPPGLYYARWADNARVAGINNAPEGYWALECAIRFNGVGVGLGNGGPTVAPATIDIVGRGEPYTQFLNTQDPEVQPVSNVFVVGDAAPNYGPTSQIPGIFLNPTNGLVTISAANTAALALGRWVYKVRATDVTGATSERDVLIVVQETNASTVTNNRPSLSAIGPKTVAAGTPLSFVVSGTDVDVGDTITVQSSSLPTGSTFPAATGVAPAAASSTFNWTPTPAQVGIHYVYFECFDDDVTILIDAELVTITVTGANTPPVLDPVGNRTVANGGTLTFTVDGSDVNGDNLTYSAYFLPTGASFTPGTRTFTWTPAPGQYNTVHTGIVFRVTDDGTPNLYDEESIIITVGSGNNPPVVSGFTNQTIALGQTVTVTVNATDVNAAQTLFLDIGSGGFPPGATFPSATGVSPISSTFTWTPVATGVTVINFRCEDNGSPALFVEVPLIVTVADQDTAISEVSSNASVTIGGGYQNIWQIQVTDQASGDLLPTIIDSITFSFVPGTFNANAFNWRRDGVLVADSVTANSITFNNGGGGNVLTVADGASGTIQLQVEPLATNSATADGTTLPLTLASANIAVAFGSSAFATNTIGNTTDTEIDVVFDRLTLKSTVPNPATGGVANAFDYTVWFTDSNGNLDTDLNGNTVTVARDDTHATTGQIQVGAGGYGATASGNAVAGTVAFTGAGAGQLSFGANASPAANSRTLSFTSASVVTGGNPGHSASPAVSNTFSILALNEVTLVAGPGAEAPEVLSDSNGSQTMALDFSITDAGTDDMPASVSFVTVSLAGSSGTLNDGVWRLTNGAVGSDLGASVVGTINGTNLEFDLAGAAQSIVVADGTAEDYRVTFEPNAALLTSTEGQRWSVGVTNGSVTLATTGSGSAIGGSVTNAATATGGMELDVDATEMRFDFAGLPTSPPISGNVATALTAGNTFLVRFTDVYGNRDLNAGNFDANTVAVTWSGVGAVSAGGSVNVTNGSAEFAGLTIAGPGLIAGTITITDNGILRDDGATPVGAAALMRTFDLRQTADADATLATGSTDANSISSVGGAQNVWQIDVTDGGASDRANTVVTGLTINVTTAGGVGNDIADFTWRLNGTAAASVNTVSGNIVFTLGANVTVVDGSTLSTHDGAGVVTDGAVTPVTLADGLTLSIEPIASVGNPLTLDGMQLQNISVTALSVAAGSTTFTGLPLTKAADVTVAVTATQLRVLVQPGDGLGLGIGIVGEEHIGQAFDVQVEYIDANGNRDLDVDGDRLTATRSDAGVVTAGTSDVASDGLVNFNVGNPIILSTPEDLSGTLFLNLNDDAGASSINISGATVATDPFKLGQISSVTGTDPARHTHNDNGQTTVVTFDYPIRVTGWTSTNVRAQRHAGKANLALATYNSTAYPLPPAGGSVSTSLTLAETLFPGETVDMTMTTGLINNITVLPLRNFYVLRYRQDVATGPALFDAHRAALGTGSDATSCVRLADVNGDGVLDLLVAINGGQNHVRLGLGNGAFALATLPFGTGTDATQVLHLLDLDGDGDLDCFVGNMGEQDSMYVNDGTGAFAAGAAIGGAATLTSYATSGDVNGDGFPDLCVASLGGQNLVYLHNGAAALSGGTLNTGTGTDLTTGLALGDVNNDGFLDLFTANQGQCTLRRNDATGMLLGAITNFGAVQNATSVDMGDLDNDGDIDILIGNDGATNKAYANDGTGAFALSAQFGSATSNSRILLLDADGDGDLDAAEITSNETDQVWLNNAFSFLTARSIDASVQASLAIASGDIDGDGDLDLALGRNGGRDFLHFNAYGPTTLSPTAADVDAAQASDLIASMNDNALATPTGATMRIHASERGQIASIFSGGGTSTLTANPDLDFRPGERVWTTLTSGNTSAAGFANRPRVWEFRAAAGAGPGLFSAWEEVIGAATSSSDIATGDFDNDGDLDALVTRNPGQAQVFLNAGSGLLTAGSITIGGAADAVRTLAVADVNNDGTLDALLGLAGGQSRVYFNLAGAFLTSSAFGPAAGNPADFALGDLDGDGDPDLVIADDGAGAGGQSRVLLNDGAGNFNAGTVLIGGAAGRFVALDLADIDSDGDLDICVGDATGQDHVLLNTGTATFDATGIAIGGAATATRDLRAGDLNGDGFTDLVIARSGGTSEVWINDSYGIFSGPAISFGGVSTLDALELLDGDGDGDLDIAAIRNGDQNAYYRNQAGVSFPLFSQFSSAALTSVALASGDMDGDGDVDLVEANDAGGQDVVRFNQLVEVQSHTPLSEAHDVATNTTISVMLNSVMQLPTDATFAVFRSKHGKLRTANAGIAYNGAFSRNQVATLASSLSPGEQVDVSLTGAFQNLNATSLSTPTVFRFTARAGAGPGRFDTRQKTTQSFSVASEALAMADVDLDGLLDIAIGVDGGSVRVYRNLGDGFSSQFQDLGAGLNVFDLAFGDLNGDGYPDLVAAVDLQTNRVFLNDGSGQFTTTLTFGVGIDRARSVAIGDVDADGDLDVVIGNSNQSDSVFTNDGAGNLAFFASVGLPADVTNVVRLADIDRDNDLDIVAGIQGGQNKVLLNEGGGLFTAGSVAFGPGNDITADLHVADYTGDGAPDIAVCNTGGQSLLYTSNGAGTAFVAGSLIGGAGDLSYALSGGDIDGDGDIDLVLGRSSAQSLVLTNDGTGVLTSSHQIATFATLGRATSLGDLDNDGDLDLVLAVRNAPDIVMFNAANPASHTPAGSSNAVNASQALSLALNADVTNASSPTVLAVHGAFSGSRSQLNFGDAFAGGSNSASLSMTPGTTFFAGEIVRTSLTDTATTPAGVAFTPYVWQYRLATTDGNATFNARRDLGSAIQTTTALAFADIDRDGDLDAIAGHAGVGVNVLTNNGIGVYSDSAQTLAAATTVSSLAVFDIDRDGDCDIVIGINGAANRVYINNGTGVFADSAQALGASATSCLAFGDVDGDGDLDLLEGISGGGNRLWLNAAGVFTDAGISLGANVTSSLDLVDLDRDGDLDVVEGVGGGLVRVWVQVETGTFLDSGQGYGNVNNRVAAVADFNNDQYPDLAIGVNGANLVLLNDTTGHFVDTTQALGSADTRVVSVGDLDADGDIDLVSAGGATAASIWLNNGSGVFTVSAQTFGGGADTRVLQLVDTRSNGSLDAAVGEFGALNRIYLNGVDSTSTVTAGALVEPGSIDSITGAGVFTSVFDLALTDPADGDTLPTRTSGFVISVGGNADASEHTWRMTGPDVPGSVNGVVAGAVGAQTVTFSGLTISVSDGFSETYTVQVKLNLTPTNTLDNHHFDLSLTETGVLVTQDGSQMLPGQPAVSNGVAGLTYEVVASRLAITAQPGNGTAGELLSAQPAWRAEDIAGNLDRDYSTQGVLSISTDPSNGSAVLVGTTASTPVAGLGSFTNARIDVARTGYRLRITSGTLTSPETSLFNVIANSPLRLVPSVQPNAQYVANDTISVSARVEDAYGNLIVNDNGRVVTASVGPGSPQVSGSFTSSSVSGIVSFPVLRVRTVGTAYVFTYTSPTLINGVSSGFDVIAASASKIGFATQPPASVQAGTPLGVSVEVQDQWGNRVPSDNGRSISMFPLANAPTLGGTTTATTTNGVATFPTLSVLGTGTDFTLEARTAGYAAAVSTLFSVVNSLPSALRMRVQPAASYTAGATITVQVEVLDNQGNLVSADNGRSISVALDGAPTLFGTAVRTTANGIALFPDLSVQTVATGLRLHFTSTGLTEVYSTTFAITPAAATALDFALEPSLVNVAGTNLTYQVEVQDQYGNRVTNGGSRTLVASLEGFPGVLLGQTSVATTAGLGSFQATRIQLAGVGYQIRVNSTGLTSSLSQAFDVVAASAHSLAITQQPVTSVAGVAIPVQVEVRDTYGNRLLADNGRDITIAIGNDGAFKGSATLGGLLTVQTIAGRSDFLDLAITRAGDDYTLIASAAIAQGSMTSSAFDITPDVLAQVQISSSPTTAVVAGELFSVRALLQDQYGNDRDDTGIDATIALDNDPSRLGNAVLLGTTARTSLVGAIEYTGLSIQQAGVGYLLRVTLTSGPIAGADDLANAFDIVPQIASALEILADAPATVTAGTNFGASVHVIDQYGNRRTDNDITITAGLAKTGTPGQPGSLTGIRQLVTNAGVVTYTQLVLERAGTPYALRFSTNVTGAYVADGADISVVPSNIDRIEITQQPALQTIAGQPLPVTTRLVDSFGNLVSANGIVVNVAIQDKPHQATLLGTRSQSSALGVVSFPDLAIERSGSGYTLIFSSSSVFGSVESQAFAILPGPVDHIAIEEDAPALFFAGDPMSMYVSVRDAFGNLIDDDGRLVHAVIATDGAGQPPATILNTTSSATLNGYASFMLTSVDRTGSNYEIDFTSTGITSARTRQFDVLHAAGAQLALVQQPGGARGGEAFDQQPRISVLDQYGNLCTRDNSTRATATILIDPTSGAATLSSALNLNPARAQAGIIGFHDLTIDVAATNYLLRFDGVGAAAAYDSAFSGFFDVTAGAPHQIEIVTQPAGDRALRPFTTQPVLRLLDRGGNVASGERSVRAEMVNAGIALQSPDQRNPKASVGGIVTFDDLQVNQGGTNLVLRFLFDDDDSGAVTSLPFSIVSGTLLVLARIDDHDNNNEVNPGDDLYLQFDNVLNPSTIPTSNQQGDLDRALRLPAGKTFGGGAVASFQPDIQAMVIRLGNGMRLNPGSTRLDPDPAVLKDVDGYGITSIATLLVGDASSDIYRPGVISLKFSSNPTSVGAVLITATYTDLQRQPPTVTIQGPGGTSPVTAMMGGTGRFWSYFHTVSAADGVNNVDGPHTVTVSGDHDLRGNLFDTTNASATLVVDTSDPLTVGGTGGTINGSVQAIGDSTCLNVGDVIELEANLNVSGATLTADLGAISSQFTAPLPFTDEGAGVYRFTAPALLAGAARHGAQRIDVRVVTPTASHTFAVYVIVDLEGPRVFANATPVRVRPAGSVLVSVSFNELIFTRPVLVLAGAGMGSVLQQEFELPGELPRRSFSFSPVLPADGSGSVQATILNALDCAGNNANPLAGALFTVEGAAPATVVDAGQDLELGAPTYVDLTGKVTGPFTSVRWEQIAGPSVTMLDATTLNARVQTVEPGEYIFRLLAFHTASGSGSGGSAATSADHVRITVPEVAPEISAGADLHLHADDVRFLSNGSRRAALSLRGRVFERNRQPIVDLRWRADPANPTGLALANPSSLTSALTLTSGERMNPGVYIFHLEAHDLATLEAGAPVRDSVRVVVTDASFSAPSADAGLDQVATVNTSVTLDGRFSTSVRPDGSRGSLSYAWTLVRKPAPSISVLSDSDQVVCQFMPDRVGVYEAELVVTDEAGVASRSDRVVVAVSAPSATPTARLVPRAYLTQVHDDLNNDGSIQPGESLALSAGPATGPAGERIHYRWVQTAGAAVMLFSSANSGNQTLNSLQLPLTPGSYRIAVTPYVLGEIGDGVSATLSFNVVAQAQDQLRARASIDPIDDPDGDGRVLRTGNIIAGVSGNNRIELSALNSSPIQRISSYRWVQLAGPHVALTAPDNAVCSFVPTRSGSYTFELTIMNQQGIEASTQLSVVVDTSLLPLHPDNRVPSISNRVALTTDNMLSSFAGRRIELIAEASDLDGDTTGVTWVQVAGSAIPLERELNRTFVTLPAAGEYRFVPYASDASDRSAPGAVVIIDVQAASLAPKYGDGGTCTIGNATGLWSAILSFIAVIVCCFAARLIRRRRSVS